MATYNIGPGETYETLAELEAAVVLAAGDIVDGGGNTFLESWSPLTAGTDGNHIVYQNATLDGENIRTQNIYDSSRDYITFVDIEVINSAATSVRGRLCDGLALENITIGDSSSHGVLIQDVNGCVIDGLVCNGKTGASVAGVLVATSTDVVISNSTIDAEANAIWLQSAAEISDIVISGGGTLRFDSIASGTSIVSGVEISESNTVGLDIADCVMLLQADGIEVDNGGGGAIIDNSTFSAGSYLKNSSFIDGSGFNGLKIRDTVNLLVENVISSNNNGTGLLAEEPLTSDISFVQCESNYNGGDGISFKTGTTNGYANRCFSSYNGQIDQIAAGDGITSHSDDTEILITFNVFIENRNSGFAMVDNSNGYIYNNVTINNGDQSSVYMGVRAELYLIGSVPWLVKNNIFSNDESYPIVWSRPSVAHVFDYNCYISDSLTPFFDADTAEAIDFETWIARVGNETNSIFIHIDGLDYNVYYGSDPTTIALTLDYSPINSEGKVVAKRDNPLINSGVSIYGVNEVGTLDPWGTPVTALPNIGASQAGGNMSDPVTVICTKNTWILVAAAVLAGTIHRKSKSPAKYLQTYRAAGSAAPEDNEDAAELFTGGDEATIGHTAAIDVYVQAVNSDGEVRVDL